MTRLLVPLALLLTLAPLTTNTPDSGGDPVEVLVAASPQEAKAHGLEVIEEVGFGWVLAESPAAVSPDAADEIASATGLRIEPNQILHLAADPLFDDQWDLENTGQTGGVADADIDVTRAWDFTSGSPGVVVAVLDTGIAFDHPDLAGRVWVNAGEVGGNGIDDDGNGWVDDIRGWDAVDDDPDPADSHGHGTFVASTAVAASNGVGMTGVAPGARVMPIRVCTGSGCSLASIVSGLAYAVANGADIANLSFGGNISPSVAMEQAVQAAVDAGIVVVAAAGNDGSNNDQLLYYPAGFNIDGLLAVAASDDADQLASFSNYGKTTVDLAAPGADVIGAVPATTWASGSGTSFSAPLVSGAAALIRSVRPDLDPVGVADLITASVDKLSSMTGRVATGGRLNAGTALEQATSPVARPTATPSDATLPASVVLDGSGSFDPSGSLVSHRWTLPDGTVRSGSVIEWSPKRPGTFTATLMVTDDDGLVDIAGVSFEARLLPGGSFVDDNGHFAERAIEAIRAEGITMGCNPPTNDRFCPNAPVSRGEMAAFLARALRIPAAVEDAFSDDDGSVFEGAIDRIAVAGITVGCNPPDNTRFCPDRAVSRAEMAVFLVRAFHLPAGPEDGFVDDDGVFENAIDRLAAAGITTGCNPPLNDRYCPDKSVTRAEMAVFLARALRLEPISPPSA